MIWYKIARSQVQIDPDFERKVVTTFTRMLLQFDSPSSLALYNEIKVETDLILFDYYVSAHKDLAKLIIMEFNEFNIQEISQPDSLKLNRLLGLDF